MNKYDRLARSLFHSWGHFREILWDEFGALQGQNSASVGRGTAEIPNPVLSNVERFGSRYDDELMANGVFESLPMLHKTVLKYKYIERGKDRRNYTFDKIAEKMGIDSSLVRRMHKNACDKLKMKIKEREDSKINGFDISAELRIYLKKLARQDALFRVLN